MSSDEFAAKFDVSRETIERLEVYAELLRKWNPAINLVAKSTLSGIWGRHFVDSAQLLPFLPDSGHWADVGSGGGFPGLVLAIIAAERHPALRFSLVESDQRKASFLSTVAREVDVDLSVRAERLETLKPLNADVVSARALAPLPKLFELISPHLAVNGRAVLLKGAASDQEIEEALASWRFTVQKLPSQSDPRGVILSIGGLSRV